MQSGEGKSDMERLGIFKEMSYISVGAKYTPPALRKTILSCVPAYQVSAHLSRSETRLSVRPRTELKQRSS